MLDPIAKPLGIFLKFIYDTLAFHNYGLAIIIFTLIVRLALLPLTLKQYKSSAKMQELQPIISDIQKRYKDDKEKLNQEMMKVYQEHNYNPAGGCLPLLLQFPILITLYWVIVQPIKFMLRKPEEIINKLVEIARTGLGKTAQQMMGTNKELTTLNYFNKNPEALSQTQGMLEKSELIDFNNFLGLHLGETARYNPTDLFGPEAHIYLPLFILVILATATTFISSKLTMMKPQNNNNNSQQGGMAGSMSNSMLYIGPLMTLMFSFQLPAGVILYWMAGYVVAIFQQLYVNKYVLKKHENKDQKVIGENKPKEANNKALNSGDTGNTSEKGNKQLNAGDSEKKGQGSQNKGGNKKNNGKKKKGAK